MWLAVFDVTLTDDQILLARSVREFAEREIRPRVREWDEAQHFPAELLPALADLGLMGIQIPDTYGGAGMSSVDYCVALEELARVDPSVSLSVAAHNGLGTAHIAMFGSEAQRRRYVMMGLATLGGGLVIGLSAGLLAPVIGAGLAAGFTTIGVAGTNGFLAGSAGAARSRASAGSRPDRLTNAVLHDCAKSCENGTAPAAPPSKLRNVRPPTSIVGGHGTVRPGLRPSRSSAAVLMILNVDPGG